MKVSKLSLALTLAITLGTTFTVAHAETASTSNTPYSSVKDTNAIAKTASDLKSITEKTITGSKTNAPIKTQVPLIKKEDLPAGVYTDTLSHWSRTPIQYMSNKGYISGFADGSFHPNEPITREQVATIYSKILKSKVSEKELTKLTTKAQSVTYSDVSSGQWSAEPIALVSAAGIMEGTSKTNFKPSETLTREEFAVTVAKLVEVLHIKTKSTNKSEKITFKDGATINKIARASIDTLAQKGFIASGDSVMFRPNGEISRGEASSILYRVVGNTLTKASDTATITPLNTSTESSGTTSSTSTVTDVPTQTTIPTITDTETIISHPGKVDTTTVKPTLPTVASETSAKSTTQTTAKTTVKNTAIAALTEKQQIELEDKVFSELNKLYKTPEDFQKYGVMYWRDNTLHVALKSDMDMATTQANLANRHDSIINKYVFVEASRYSQLEYDTIDSNFRKYYATHEKTGQVLATFPDVQNNLLYAVVSTATATTQQNIMKAFGDKVKMSIKH